MITPFGKVSVISVRNSIYRPEHLSIEGKKNENGELFNVFALAINTVRAHNENESRRGRRKTEKLSDCNLYKQWMIIRAEMESGALRTERNKWQTLFFSPSSEERSCLRARKMAKFVPNARSSREIQLVYHIRM